MVDPHAVFLVERLQQKARAGGAAHGKAPDRFERSLAQASLRRVEAKELLYAEGDAISHVYRIETGAIALFKVLADGRRQVMGFAYPGDLIGLGIEHEHAMNAQAVKATRVLNDAGVQGFRVRLILQSGNSWPGWG